MKMMKKSECYILDACEHLSLQKECKQATIIMGAKCLAKSGKNNTASQM
jgi:hypothetical protein